ncbi:MAG: patatin-like phospholipase family protein [Desulfatitalea sp.]|nr:patatin-like phospholipase family protein [Desulfatitalea sp.]
MKRLLAGLLLVCFVATPACVLPNASSVEKRLTIGLALGSGGAGGLAHIGMLQVFDELNIKPDRIVGTSIGAVIGGLYAAGLDAAVIRDIFEQFGGSELDVLTKLMEPTSALDLGDLVDLDISNGALFDSNGFLKFLLKKISARTFKELAIPLEVISTDYWTGKTVVLDSGDLFTAIQASMAVPGLFTPVVQNDRLLIDGGTSNPLPFDQLTGKFDIIIAIDVSGSRDPASRDQVGWSDLLFNTFEIMQQSIIAEKRQQKQPHIYIKPDIRNIRLLHFNRIDEILEQAKPAASELKERLAARLKEAS